MHMNPVIFQYGPVALHWYGLLIVGGAVVGAWFAGTYAKKAGENPDHIWNLLAWSLLAGIIGARLYHVFSNPADGYGWPYYREHPLEIINFWNGGFRGLGIYGGLVGGIIAVILYCWRNRLEPLRYLDFIAPNVLIAQAIGRLGNFANQELYGPVTTLPWAFHINPRYPCQLPPDLPQTIQLCGTPTLTDETLAWYATQGYHPTFFYEAGWNLLMFLLVTLIIWRFGHRLRTGDGVLLYLLAYPLGRFWVEMFRPDAWVLGTLPAAQWIALGAILFSLIALIWRHRQWSWRDHPEDSLVALRRQPIAPEASQP
jgi:phosphatidylglycerol---prolipoprotein diacylglyceryl transferase